MRIRTSASVAGHPIHPMLVPLGGFVLSFALDLIGLISGDPSPNLWSQLAYYTMIGSIIGALATTVPGLVDLLSLPTDIRATTLMQLAINLTVVAIYVVNALMRHSAPGELALPMILSLIAISMLLTSGWIGGRMALETGVGASEPT